MLEPRASVSTVSIPIGFALALGACSSSTTEELTYEPGTANRSPGHASASQVPITHGVTIGEVTSESVVVWARADQPADMNVVLERDGREVARGHAQVAREYDNTGTVRVSGLAPGIEYQYAVWMTSLYTDVEPGPVPEYAVRGTVRTAPAADAPVALRFAWGGDLAGQDVCRDRARGFAIMDHLGAETLDFFVALGDMIYADNPCTERGMYGNEQVAGLEVATEIQGFWAHWRYAREDPAFASFLARVPVFPVWDDHETINDVGPAHDTRSTAPYQPDARLLPIGLRAFLDYNPLERSEARGNRLYRSARWGKHLELFFLDTRQYRDANSARDTGAVPKTMLGAEQRDWFVRSLTASDATWKVVISSVPMSIPTGSPPEAGRDGWANHDQETGFERELLGILRALDAAGQDHTIWLTTDVHFATGFRYAPFPGNPDFQVHEWVSGPLNAGLYPQDAYDPTLNPTRLFFYGPADPGSLRYDEALGWMNYGRVEIDERGGLTVSIINGRGETVHEHRLPPPANP